MELTSHNIPTLKTARYFQFGNDKQHVSKVLFVLHGYGMQAKTFIDDFEGLVEPGTLVVAPEGLSRFYRKGFAGEVVASWMTSDDRGFEIEDYIHYLDNLYDVLVKDQEVKVFVLGFSQGASTASRWVMRGNRKVNGLVLWSGEFAPDITEFNSGFKTIWQVIGTTDQFISLDRHKTQLQYLDSKGFEVLEVVFDGGHEVDQSTLLKVWRGLQQQP